MSQSTLDCPRCGAPLDLPANPQATMECPYCKNTVIVPLDLRSAAASAAPGGLTPAHIANVHRLLQANQKIEAVKVVRQLTGLGLKESKDLVEAIERGESIDAELQVLSAPKPASVLDVQKLAELGRLVHSGNKIEAIKMVRELTGLGLKESKDMVEAMERGEPVQLISQSTTSSFGSTVSSLPQDVSPELEKQLRSLLQINNRAGALRLLRQRMDLSQAVAERTIDDMTGGANLAQSLTHANWNADLARLNNPQASRAVKVAAGTAAGTAGCSVLFTVLLTVGILLLTLGIVAVAFLSPGGPFAEYGSRINPFSSARMDLAFGGEGSGQGLFLDPRQIALAPDGTLYVSDFETGRVQHFGSDGEFLNLWIIPGTDTQDEVYINDLEVDSQGRVYVVAGGELRIYDGTSPQPLQVLDPTYQLPGDPWESDLYIDDLEFAPDGTRYILESDTLARLDANGGVDLLIEELIEKITKDSETIGYLAIDGLGNLYVAGGNNYAVFKYDRDGNYQTRFGSQGDQPGQFNAVLGIATDQHGRVYVSSSYGIDVFEGDGRFINRISLSGVAFDLKIDDQDRLWMITNINRVMRFQLSPPAAP